VKPSDTLGLLLRRQAERIGDRVFLTFEGAHATFAQVERRSNQLANVLSAHGVRPGDHIAVVMSNGIDFPTLWLTLAKMGGVMVPVNVQYRDRDLAYALTHSDASLAIASAEHLTNVLAVRPRCPQLREVLTLNPAIDLPAGVSLIDEAREHASAEFAAPDVDPTQVLTLQYTSGTTGLPKGCLLTHEYWLHCAQTIGQCGRVTAADVMLTAQPFYYMDPQWQTALCLMTGMRLVIAPRFSASTFWRTVKQNGATLCYLLGTMPLYLLKQPENPEVEKRHAVRLVLCSGIPANLHARFEERWNAPWREMYGTTESGADLAVPIEDGASVGTGAMGKAVGGKQAMVVDTGGREVADGIAGELVVRGQPMMLGYYKDPHATAEKIRDGWLHTGDLVLRDEQGYFHMVGRIKEMIRRSGENISAAEVEAVICEHPAVLAAAVVPVPDDLRQEEVKAIVQLRPGWAVATAPPDELVAFVRGRLAAFKVPRYVAYADDLPRTPSERIAKYKLVAAHTDLRSGCYDAVERRWIG
jgi:acyl-CoA synthetase (AMP-forming)/AMP-acid ligase II